MVSTAILLTFIVIVVLFVYSWYAKHLEKYKNFNKLPGPSVIELILGLLKNRNYYERYLYFMSFNKKYGSTFKIWLKPLTPIIMTADIEYFDKILASNKHIGKGTIYNGVKAYTGNGLGTNLNVESWKKDRKMCNMAFQHTNVTSLLPLFTQHSKKLLQILERHNGKELNLQSVTHRYTLDVIFETLVRRRYNFQEYNNNEYISARDTYFTTLTQRIYSLLLLNDFLFKCFGNFKALEESLRTMKKFTADIIQDEKRRRHNGGVDNSKMQLVDILFANVDDNEVLGNHIDTFILAGHHTTGQTICFALYELSKHPNLQQRVFDEIISILGNDKDANITNKDLQEMKYLECVIKETLRYRTIAYIVQRNLSEDTIINDVNHPKDTSIIFNLKGIHESEKYFKNANKFDPDRFAFENQDFIPRSSYAPFALGARDCIGKQYAQLLIKYSVAKVLQKFQLMPVENHVPKLFYDLLTTSLNGLPVILQERT